MNSILRQLLTLALGAAAGTVAAFMHLPIPWMIGSMLANTVAAMSGVPVRSPSGIRPIVIPVVGVLLGSSLTPEFLHQAPLWIGSVAMVPVFIACVATAGTLMFMRLGGYDLPTAFFAAVPGSLSNMLIVGGELGGDERRIATAHAVRIVVAISLIVVFYGTVLGASSSGNPDTWTALSDISLRDGAWLVAAALVGGLLSARLPIPAGSVLLPAAISGALHIAGVVHVAPPSVLIVIAQLVIGSSVGCRFAGVSLRELRRDLGLGVLSTFIILSGTLVFSLLTHVLMGVPESQTFLSFAPGGLNEMGLIALALGENVAYVAVMHITRLVVIILAAPIVFRVVEGFRRRRLPGDPAE